MPRQPSVPNLIIGGRQSWVIARKTSVGWLWFPEDRYSHQIEELPLVQIFHHFTYVLRPFAGCDQQSVFGLDQNQVTHTHSGNKFSWRVDVISMGFECKRAFAGN